jgi:hypothetical protein
MRFLCPVYVQFMSSFGPHGGSYTLSRRCIGNFGHSLGDQKIVGPDGEINRRAAVHRAFSKRVLAG